MRAAVFSLVVWFAASVSAGELIHEDFSGSGLPKGWSTGGRANSWTVVDGVLQNRVVKEKDKYFGNLRTDAEFEDFNLKTEVRTQEGSNSGIYLRGIYEVQIAESFGKFTNRTGTLRSLELKSSPMLKPGSMIVLLAVRLAGVEAAGVPATAG